GSLRGCPFQKAPTRRQRLQEIAAVAFGEHTRVENHDHAGIATGADKAAEPLLQLDDRLRNLVVQEGHAPRRGNRLAACLDDRPVRNGERQLRDNHVRERLPLHIDALPEAVHPKQYGVARTPELLDHLRPRQTVALTQEQQSLLVEPRAQAVHRPLHRLVTGEEDKGLAATAFDIFLDLRQRRFLKGRGGGARVGQVAEEVQLGLFAVVEGTAELERVALVQPEALLEVPEPLPAADAQRRARQDHTWDLRVQHLLQSWTDVNRGTHEVDALRAFARHVDPVHLAAKRLAEPGGDAARQLLTADRGGLQFDLLLFRLHLVG